ncbi:MAG: acyl-CoA dehydratase activase [Acidobacteriota bacterium]
MSQDRIHVGVDVGSVSAKVVLIDDARNILEEHYTRTKGRPLETTLSVLTGIFSRVPEEMVASFSVTGTAGKLIAELLNAEFVNEVIAQSKSTAHFHPQVKTIIEMGGEDSKLILLENNSSNGEYRIVDFSMNTVCAAGTGSFLDQQASRMNFTIEEFGNLALKSKSPPRIAGRCSVFAKSDMIHLQQGATADYDIIAGLCYALARNFKSNIGKGKPFISPISFQGGVAANAGMRKAFLDVLELKENEFIIPKYFACMGAIGAAFITMENSGSSKKAFQGLGNLREYLTLPAQSEMSMEPLSLSEHHKKEKTWQPLMHLHAGQKIPAYLGIDVGSISTNVVVIDEKGNVLSKRYLMTAGRPIEAIRRGLDEVGTEIGHLVEIKAVGTTGSGRYLTGDYVGADTIRNEITAQATAAVHIDPHVDTIFEIGGQDSKYISLDHGAIVDFEMNKVCAAGTGSFLEEQAEKLGLSIKEEFGNLALSACDPVCMGERCTVFMESDLLHHQQRGAKPDSLVAGLSYAIVHNYLNKVVGNKRIGNNIFFQGGTAFNNGVVAAFEKVTGKKIVVPEHNEVMGAIGCALLAMDSNPDRTNFKGWDLSKRPYELSTFECQDCSNRCEIRQVTVAGENALFYGSRCEKYDIDHKRRKKRIELPDLFAEREKALYASRIDSETIPDDAPVIGIPRILTFHELMPFWRTFFESLGFRIVFSDKTNKRLIHKGLEKVVAETCFPIKVTHGHVQDLIDRGVKTIFLPSIVDMPLSHSSLKGSYCCPYVQAIPYTIRSAIDFESNGVRLLSPVIHFSWSQKNLKRTLTDLAQEMGKSGEEAEKAFSSASRALNCFQASLKERGREILKNLKEGQNAMVLISRPYNGCDPGMNMELPRKLRDLGIIAIPMDYLSLDEVDLVDEWQDMYWKYGQKIFSAAEIVHDDPRLHAIYLTNFSCGPDSFILHFFREKMRGKPYLQLEVDEHSADAGLITRLEAFMDSLKNVHKRGKKEERKPKTLVLTRDAYSRKIHIPYMTEHAHALIGAFHACNIDAQLFAPSNQDSILLGRKVTSGKECYPCILTAGDMARIVKSPDFDRHHSAFFMPSGSGPCRFGQYHRLHRLILDDLGFPDVPIYSPNQNARLYKDLKILGRNFTRITWQGVVAIDLLEKKLRETRPYEVHREVTDKLFNSFLRRTYEVVRDSKNDPKKCLAGLLELLEEARTCFNQIELMDAGSKPRIGLVGEIYIRNNPFSNENIVRQLEKLGAEVWLPTVAEWFLYLNVTSQRYNFRHRHFFNAFKIFLADQVQKSDMKKLEAVFKGDIVNAHEPTIEETLEYASPYVDDSFQGEAVLSVGKCVDFMKKGVSGLVNVMPFTCMPGTIVGAIMKRFREEHDNIPFLNMAYDGQEETGALTRLEAFMHQVRQYQKKGKEKA